MMRGSLCTLVLLVLGACAAWNPTMVSAERTGLIESKLPALKSFLKNGDAECYEGVTVKYVPGKSAVLTVSDGPEDRAPPQSYPLEHIKSLDALHELVQSLGFVWKSRDECRAIRQQAVDRQRDERERRHAIHEYYRVRDYYTKAFRTDVMGVERVEAWNHRPRISHPSGPEPDLLAENYDVINRQQAVFVPDRRNYAVDYLAKINRPSTVEL